MRVWLLLLSILILGACSPFEQKSTYDETKKMVIDALQTEDGKAFWEHSMQDPKFMDSMAKRMTAQQKELMKQLMTDPAYMKEWEEFWKQPTQQQELEKLLKSSSLREEMKKVVEEKIQNPVWTAYWQDFVMKAAEAGKGTGGFEGGPSGGGDGAGGSSGDGGGSGGGQAGGGGQ